MARRQKKKRENHSSPNLLKLYQKRRVHQKVPSLKITLNTGLIIRGRPVSKWYIAVASSDYPTWW